MTLAPGMPSTEAPDQAISLTQDGLLRKLTVEEGSGDLPPVHSRCLGRCIRVYVNILFAGRTEGGRTLSLRVKTSWLRCLCPGLFAVHYVGRLATNGEVFMDARKESTANEPVTVVAGRGRPYRKPTIELS